MEFYIKQNSTLPILKMEIIKDGRSNYNLNSFLSASTTFLISLYDRINDKFLFASKECFVTSEYSSFEGKDLYYLNYQFINKDTLKTGRYEVQISIPSNEGVIILPLQDKYYVNVVESFVLDNINFIDSISADPPCCVFQETVEIGGLTLQAYYYSGSLFADYILSSSQSFSQDVRINFTNILEVYEGENVQIITGVTIPFGETIGSSQVSFIGYDYNNLKQTSIFSNVELIPNNPNLVLNFENDSIFNTPPPTRTPTKTPTPTISATQTLTPTNTSTPTNTPTLTQTTTTTKTSTPTKTATRTLTPTKTNTPTNTITQTSTPTETEVIGETPTPTPSITQTITPTNTETTTTTPTPTNTETPTGTPTTTPTNTPSNTVTPSITPSNTVTPTVTPSNTVTPSITPSNTVTPTVTPSNTRTQTRTQTQTITVTPTFDCFCYTVLSTQNGNKVSYIDCSGNFTELSPVNSGESVNVCAKFGTISLTFSGTITFVEACVGGNCPGPTPTITPTPTVTPTSGFVPSCPYQVGYFNTLGNVMRFDINTTYDGNIYVVTTGGTEVYDTSYTYLQTIPNSFTAGTPSYASIVFAEDNSGPSPLNYVFASGNVSNKSIDVFELNGSTSSLINVGTSITEMSVSITQDVVGYLMPDSGLYGQFSTASLTLGFTTDVSATTNGDISLSRLDDKFWIVSTGDTIIKMVPGTKDIDSTELIPSGGYPGYRKTILDDPSNLYTYILVDGVRVLIYDVSGPYSYVDLTSYSGTNTSMTIDQNNNKLYILNVVGNVFGLIKIDITTLTDEGLTILSNFIGFTNGEIIYEPNNAEILLNFEPYINIIVRYCT